jgi:hypothetical protein
MENLIEKLIIEKTAYTPEVRFDGASGVMELRGESYPENTLEFYKPIFDWLRKYLGGKPAAASTLNIEIVYFNSSSSKALMNLFDMLDEAAAKGQKITVNWIYDASDDNSLKYGEEFQEDLVSLEFNLVKKHGN